LNARISFPSVVAGCCLLLLRLSQPVFSQSTQQQSIAPSIKNLGSPDPRVRAAAADQLGNLVADDPTAVRALIERLADADTTVSNHASGAIKRISHSNPRVLPVMISALKHTNSKVRYSVVALIANVGPAAISAVPSLIGAAKDDESKVREYAIRTLQQIAPSDPAAVDAFIAALQDASIAVREEAAIGLMTTLVPDQRVINALAALLERDDHIEVRRCVMGALGNKGKAAAPVVPLLVSLLKSSDHALRLETIRTLGIISTPDSGAVPALLGALKDKDGQIREYAAEALGQIHSSDPTVVAALGIALKDTSIKARINAAIALGNLEPSSRIVSILSSALQDENSQVRYNTAFSLARIGPTSAPALPALVNALKDQDILVRDAAANAIGPAAPTDLTAVAPLVESFTDPQSGIRISPAASLKLIAEGIEGQAARLPYSSLKRSAKGLQAARAALVTWQPSRPEDVSAMRQDMDALDRAIFSLQKEQETRLLSRAWDWASRNPMLTAVACWLGYLFLLWVAVRTLPPLWLLYANEALKKVSGVTLPPPYNVLSLAPGYVLGIGFFAYHWRVLDAWVRRNSRTARQSLQQRPTFAARSIFVNIPIGFPGGPKLPIPGDFQPLFGSKSALLRIWGEGGSGKTTLACQLALWALEDAEQDRLCKSHRMLPVFLEENLPGAQPGNTAALLAEVRGIVGRMIGMGETPSEDLVKQLLRQRRILLIMDGHSELDEATQKSIRPQDAALNLNALLVTSRSQTTLNDGSGLTVQTGLLQGQGIAAFVEDYLKSSGLAEPLKNGEFYSELSSFTKLVGDREITAWLAQLYVRHIIDRRENLDVERPRNIPELMDAYVAETCRKANDKAYPIQVAYPLACKIAWCGLRDTYVPSETPLSDVISALAQTDDGIALPSGPGDPSAVVAFFVDRLRLLQRRGTTQGNLKFTVDPLAEYLAVKYLVEYRYRDDEMKWSGLLEVIEQKRSATKPISGFVCALYDTCAAKGNRHSVPDFLLPALRRQFGADLPPETQTISAPSSASPNPPVATVH